MHGQGRHTSSEPDDEGPMTSSSWARRLSISDKPVPLPKADAKAGWLTTSPSTPPSSPAINPPLSTELNRSSRSFHRSVPRSSSFPPATSTAPILSLNKASSAKRSTGGFGDSTDFFLPDCDSICIDAGGDAARSASTSASSAFSRLTRAATDSFGLELEDVSSSDETSDIRCDKGGSCSRKVSA